MAFHIGGETPVSIFDICILILFIMNICAIFGIGYLLIAAKISKCSIKDYVRGMLKHRFVLAGVTGAMTSVMTWFAMIMHSL